ncbi:MULTISPECIES: hypothetical protein [Cyanophyceae]|uniref:hypothetical protein n=1 Tax=Cyanophyceae TaxID=3028117 RepID=UPI00168267BF|nr:MULTISPECIES: hypothetical protein [Cyanophyceae]MBD1916245.1 hypothetical protein [Phormidium sp. FACHB-77]MBD2031486.1 hypothetical protein [Phormidium sp. FACHB-322]MBD2052887.1 hypothetical protein [Leptolyngbya sp. FACHB-60]
MLSKPSVNITLLLIVVGTVGFVGFSLPYLNFLSTQGQLLEGISLFISGLSLLVPLGFSAYEIKQSALEQSEKKQNELGIQIIQNNLIQTLNSQEFILREQNQLGPRDHLLASNFGSEEIRNMIPPILADKADVLLSEAYRITTQVDFLRSIVAHLEGNKETLKSIAVESSNEVLSRLTEDRLKSLSLNELKDRSSFYGDIYKYLMGWLKKSIECDFPMPENRIVQASLDRKLYLDTLSNIRDTKIGKFGFSDERQENVVRRYLNILIDHLGAS